MEQIHLFIQEYAQKSLYGAMCLSMWMWALQGSLWESITLTKTMTLDYQVMHVYKLQKDVF